MAKIQHNPSTNKVIFDATTGKVQMLGSICEYCPSAKTPMRIKLTTNGILYCPNLGVCCPATGEHQVLNQGIGWNFEVVLEHGLVLFPSDYGGVPNNIILAPWSPWHSCLWGAIKEDNFGVFEVYNLADCLGGVACTQNFWKMGVRLEVYNPNPPNLNRFFIVIGFACSYCSFVKGREEWFIYQHWGEMPATAEECLPYDIELPNHQICGESGPIPPYLWNECIGGGTVVLHKLE